MEIIVNKSQLVIVEKLSAIQDMADGCNVFKALAYIVEESGELAKDLIEDNESHGRQEALDVVIAALGVFYRLGGDNEYMKKHIGKQLRKWERSL